MDTYEICLYHTGTIFQTVNVEADNFTTTDNSPYVMFRKDGETVAIFNLENIFGFKKLDT